jgi:hypothetical protein
MREYPSPLDEGQASVSVFDRIITRCNTNKKRNSSALIGEKIPV